MTKIRNLLSFATVFGGLLLLMLATDIAYAQRRVALVIGNSAYQNAPVLDNPVNDATSVAEMFRKAGFAVVTFRTELGILEFKRTLREFVNTTRDSDIAVVYYAGHAIEIGGVNYMIPVDAKLASDLDAEDEAVELDRLIRSIDPARRLRLVILDACRDNPFGRKMQRTVAVRGISNGLGKIEPTSTDTLIAYAAKAGSTAEDGADAHSPFTTALLNNLAEPGLDVRIAFGRVRDEVLRKTGNRQEPFVYGSLGGTTISLVPPPPEARKIEASATEIKYDYELAERVGTMEAWDSFLAAHGSGFYAGLARAQRAKLIGSGQAKPSTPEPSAAMAALEPPAPPRPAERVTPDRTAWDKIKDSSDPAAFRRFIKRFPTSPLALSAQHRLDLLEQAAVQRRQQELERQQAEREAARQRQEEERRAKAAEADRQKAEREATRQREEEERRAKAAEADQRKTEAEKAADLARQERMCKRDADRLARLREQGSRARDDVARLQQELGCERIRGDVVALLEQFTRETATAPAAREPQANTPELVRSAQQELRRIGCYGGRESGSLDVSTKRAIELYRAKQGQPSAEIKVTDDFVSELRQQGVIEGCVASLPKPEPVVRAREKPKPKPKPEPVAKRPGKAKTEAATRREKGKVQERREARPARREAPRAKAAAEARPRPASRSSTGSSMMGIGF